MMGSTDTVADDIATGMVDDIDDTANAHPEAGHQIVLSITPYHEVMVDGDTQPINMVIFH